MKKFTSVTDVQDVEQLVEEAIALKQHPYAHKIADKTLGLVFFNPSLRTRMSSQKAAFNLGVNVIVLNIDKDGWKIEFEDGAVMDQGAQEHIKDAAKVMSQYCDVLGVRTFASLTNKKGDYEEKTLQAFIDYSEVPVLSLESATLHPLQSLADLITIKEQKIKKPKVVLTWAPHPRALPQAVPNSFLEWIKKTDAEVHVAFPEGYTLKDEFLEGTQVSHQQDEALKNADFVYAKNWSSYTEYGKTPTVNENWTITQEKMNLTNQGKFMHCLPIRRNVIATDEVIDASLVNAQAKNREYSAQIILKKLLENA
ncbi:MAG TPA: N-acetylornithine carbamoyltransferase [Aequorivita sp.]|nr:N-acetylornithine carbamoyltransferase [Aequorivita sp.]